MARGKAGVAWLLAWLCLLFGAAPAHATLVLAPGMAEAKLTPSLSYLHDAEGRTDIDEAIALARAGRFRPMAGTALGFRDGAFWFHTRIVNRNRHEPRWLLVQRYALSDRLDIYLRYPDGRISHQAGGDTLPFRSRSIPYRHPNFWLALPPDTPIDLFVRVKSESSMQVPLSLYTPAAFTEVSRESQFGIGLYYGILVALLVYNLVLWLSLRDASYFWYVFHIGAFGLVLFTLNGLSFEYLWPNSTRFAQIAVPLFIALAQIGMQQFARTSLELSRRWPRGDRVSRILIIVFAVLAAATLFVPPRITTPIAAAGVFPSILWIALASVVAMRSGFKPARLFLLAWAMFLLGTGMFAAIAFGFVPKNFVTEYGVQIGSALEMLLLSIALGYRYAQLRNENERIVREAKHQLEQKVEKRTAELRNALAQLGDAHVRLRESSQRDALTGLHTRSHFREAFNPMLSQAREERRALSLLMIDLDHFKQINDRYGHLTGDECLRWAAQRVGQTLRAHPSAVLARFGGEEFIVALPGLDRAAAASLAEAILAHLRAAPCSTHDHEVPMTASIGVHQVDPTRERGIEDALREADVALYRAKHDGRNCVRVTGADAG